jgi:hypothetical protein
MALYTCSRCGGKEQTGWTDYYVRRDMDLPLLCALCDPKQRCHWHGEVARRAQDEAALGEVDAAPVDH